MRHLYEVELSEKELAEIIAALRSLGHSKLADRLESELWAPYHESVARGRHQA